MFRYGIKIKYCLNTFISECFSLPEKLYIIKITSPELYFFSKNQKCCSYISNLSQHLVNYLELHIISDKNDKSKIP